MLTCLVAFFLSPPCNGLISFCSLFFLHILATRIPQPKNDQHQHLGGTWPAAIAGGSKLATSLHPLRQGCSGERGAGLLSLLPLTTVRGRSQLCWPSQSALGSLLGLERLRRVCHACCARAICWQTGSGWGGCPAAGQPTVACSFW